MKFNWGTGITIFIIGFMGFILFMVFKASNTKSDLYAKDYYKQEMNYQSKIDAEHNVKKLKGKITITQNNEDVIITYPTDFEGKKLKGNIHFFRPDNVAFDKVFEITTEQHKQHLSKENLVKGWYQVKVNFESEKLNYFIEKRIQIN